MTRLPRLTQPPLPLTLRRWLPLIIGLAVGIRVALGWMHPLELPDSLDYKTLADTLVHHQPYASVSPLTHDTSIAARMPGYPLFLAAIFAIGGGVKTAMVLQGLMGGIVVLLTYLLGLRLSQTTALIAAALIALDPLTIGFSAAVLSETPFTLCLMASLWLCLRIAQSGADSFSRRAGTLVGRSFLAHWIALGLLWGVAVYLRASALWAILPISVLAARPRLPQTSRRRHYFAFIPLALTFALLSPWLIRNYQVFHSGPLRLTTLEGISLYEAVYPAADGGPRQDKIPLPDDMKPLNEAQRNDEWSRRAWSYIQEDPLRIAHLAVIKIGRTWSPWFNAADFRAGPIQLAMALWNIPLFALALLGLTQTPRRLLILLLIPLLYFTAVHALFLGSVRYRVPLMPIVCLLAAHGIFLLLNWWRSRKRLTS